MNGPKSEPPCSMTMTECLPSSLSRAAMAEPAEPAPTMTKSASMVMGCPFSRFQ
jgi:hypothetical protein